MILLMSLPSAAPPVWLVVRTYGLPLGFQCLAVWQRSRRSYRIFSLMAVLAVFGTSWTD